MGEHFRDKKDALEQSTKKRMTKTALPSQEGDICMIEENKGSQDHTGRSPNGNLVAQRSYATTLEHASI
nr:hypothetical protein Itr_chr12CG13120 [Ipomoea trifida]